MLSDSDPRDAPEALERGSHVRARAALPQSFSRQPRRNVQLDLTDDVTQRALGLHYALPHGLSAWQEPWWRERRERLARPRVGGTRHE